MDALKRNTLFACFLISVKFWNVLMSSGITFTKLQHSIEMSSYRCGPAHTVFEIGNVSNSLICGKFCLSNKYCQLISYQPNTHTCIGCNYLWIWIAYGANASTAVKRSQFYFKHLVTNTEPRECYNIGFSKHYRGHQSMTRNGTTCQNWNAREPHPPRIEATLSVFNLHANALNYCRDPDYTGTPWCYTINPRKRWEYCDVPQCSGNEDCYKEGYAWQYMGTTNMTKGMLECQRWDQHLTNGPNWPGDLKFPEATLSEVNNYCRNPERQLIDQPWCYTNENKSWDYCDIKKCPEDFCYEDVSRNYRGQVAITETGKECQRWDSKHPHIHYYGNKPSKFPDNSVSDAANYCRDPSSSGRPWCFTTDPEKKWDWCAVTKCENSSDEN